MRPRKIQKYTIDRPISSEIISHYEKYLAGLIEILIENGQMRNFLVKFIRILIIAEF